MTSRTNRPDTGPGLDIFRNTGVSQRGFLPCGRTGDRPGARRALPYATLKERDAALYLAFHPGVAYIQRGDIKASFAEKHDLDCRLPVPFVIPYEHEGRQHEYLIDWVGLTTAGTLFGVEASIVRFKDDPQSASKLASADAFFRARGGWFGLYLPDDAVSETRLSNLKRLSAHLEAPFASYEAIAPDIRTVWSRGEAIPIVEVIERLAGTHAASLVAEACWRTAAIAASEGRLVADLDAALLDLHLPLRLARPGEAPVMPPVLPVSLVGDADDTSVVDAPPVAPRLPGPTVDPASLSDNARSAFLRNLRAVHLRLDGASAADAGAECGLTERYVRRLTDAALARGEEACIPYRRPPSAGSTRMDPLFIEPIRKLMRRRQRLSFRQIAEAPELRAVALAEHKRTGSLPVLPSERQVRNLAHILERTDTATRDAREGVRHASRGATSIKGYVASIASPALVIQVDEQWCDVFVRTEGGDPITERVHIAAAVCAKTGAIMGVVASPRALTDEDYGRLVKQCIEPKDEIVRRAGCLNAWDCRGRPVEILSDRGAIFIDRHMTEVIVDRLRINQSVAPPFSPSVKGVVEALWRWVNERFTHRLEGTTKRSPADRGTYDSQAAALKDGITFSELETLLFRAVVDGYMQDWDDLRGGPRHLIWARDVERFGVPRWTGTADEMKLLLLRAHNPKHPLGRYLVGGAGVSFLGNHYVGEEGLTRRLRGEFVTIHWDRRDLGTIYLADTAGRILGAAHCPEYLSRRVSLWEQQAERRAQKDPRSATRAASSTNLTSIVGTAQTYAADRRKEARRKAREASRGQFLDGQVAEIHPPEVLAERRRRAEEARGGPAWLTDPSLLPGPDDTLAERVVAAPVRRRTRHETTG